MDKSKTNRLISILLAIICCLVAFVMVGNIIDACTINRITPQYVPYDTFQEGLAEHKIFALYTDSYSTKVRFQYKSDISEENADKDPNELSIMDLDADKWFYTSYVDCDMFSSIVLESGTPLVGDRFTSRGTMFLQIVLSLLPTVLLFVMLYLFISVFASQMRLGDSKYEVSKTTGITFDDVIGHDEVIADINFYISLLSNPRILKDNHVKPPKGILFTGAPGTGKTLLAKAMAGTAKVPFIYLNSSSVIELFAGMGAKTIRSCFKKARELAPCIVFLDEIDAIGNRRGATQNSSSEDTQTLLALLQELDGFSTSAGILVIAATNCPDNLDPALRRSGRFDREIVINLPRNKAVREKLLQFYTREYKLADDVNLSEIAGTLAGMSGADIANICNEAAIVALRNSDSCIHQEDFATATDKLMLKGNKLQNKSLINEHDRRIVAYHEAGHAIVSYLCGQPVSRISIQGTTSGVGGFVLPEDKESQFRTSTDLLNQIKVCYGGRCSEVIKFGVEAATTGASNDIQQATEQIYKYIGLYGFSENGTGNGVLLNYQALANASIVDKNLMCSRMERLATKIYSETIRLLENNFELVEALAIKLLDNETMLGSEVNKLLESLINGADLKVLGIDTSTSVTDDIIAGADLKVLGIDTSTSVADDIDSGEDDIIAWIDNIIGAADDIDSGEDETGH